MRVMKAVFLLVLFVTFNAFADNRNQVKTLLSGYHEVLPVSTTGHGEFHARIDEAAGEIQYTLTYDDLEGEITTQAHIHFGTPGLIGGVMVFLCGGGDKPACTPTSGNISGTIDAADVIGPAGQGIAATEFAEVIRAIRNGASYVNVHTNLWPVGEIRGQIRTVETPASVRSHQH